MQSKVLWVCSMRRALGCQISSLFVSMTRARGDRTVPEGHGISGLLIVDRRPLRLPDLGEHPDRLGFPPNHPRMTSFLSVPIAVRGKVFGNL